MVLTSIEVGLCELGYRRALFGGRSCHPALLKPGRCGQGLACGAVKPRQCFHGAGISSQPRDIFVGGYGACRIAKLLFEKVRRLLPKVGRRKPVVLFFQLARLHDQDVGQFGVATARPQQQPKRS